MTSAVLAVTEVMKPAPVVEHEYAGKEISPLELPRPPETAFDVAVNSQPAVTSTFSAHVSGTVFGDDSGTAVSSIGCDAERIQSKYIPQYTSAGKHLFNATQEAGLFRVDTPSGADVSYRYTMDLNYRHPRMVAVDGSVVRGVLRFDQSCAQWLEVSPKSPAQLDLDAIAAIEARLHSHAFMLETFAPLAFADSFPALAELKQKAIRSCTSLSGLRLL